jgi:hypothetical protein
LPPAPVRIVRDLRLDLFRGLALLLIFLDRLPSNVIRWATVRNNHGFSDAAEIFCGVPFEIAAEDPDTRRAGGV